MRKNILTLLFILFVNQIYSQETENIILKFHGYNYDPYQEAFVTNYIVNNTTSDDIQSAINYYIQNEKKILVKYDNERFKYYFDTLIRTKQKNNKLMSDALNLFANFVTQGVVEYQKVKLIEKEKEAVRKEQQRAELAERQAQNKQKYAEFQAMTNRKVHSSDFQSNTSPYSSQKNYNGMLTSDPDRIKAVQLSVEQQGASRTRDAINQANAYDTQSKPTGGYNGQIVSAVTENRRAIQIQVREKNIGNRVVAYSLGADAGGIQQWKPCDGIISKCTSNYEFQYSSYIDGLGTIYFN